MIQTSPSDLSRCRTATGATVLAFAATLAGAASLSAQQRTTLPILDAATLTAACEYTLEDARKRAAELEKLTLAEADVATVLEQWDRDAIALEDVLGPVSILNNVHPDRSVRDAAEQCLQKSSQFSTELYQNEALYQRIASVQTEDPIERKVRDDLLESFEDNGVNLPTAERERASEIADRLTVLRQEFDRNLRDDTTRLVFTPDEYRGVPESYVERARKQGEAIVVTLESPDYVPFMRNALNTDARERYYRAMQNLGAPRNIEILEEIVELREELARLHGKESYAEYVLQRRMAAHPDAVDSFLQEVRSTVSEAERRELDEIRRHKAALTGEPEAAATLASWDVAFYRERLREERYSIDQEQLRQYFPTAETMDWVLDMSGRLYDVAFTEAEVPVWHPEVRYFDVTDNATGDHLGGLYVDLFPREGKYNHAAVWPVRRSSEAENRRPISVLVTNFDRVGLTHSELETLLHELGHALHNLFSTTRFNLHGGTAVERDFVEAPSQMFEAWARSFETLSTLRESCEECPALTREIVERLDAARRFGLGARYADQRRLAELDRRIHTGTVSDVMAVWREIDAESPLGHVEGTHFPARFGHLANHYGAGYYGYMWSEVIAFDLVDAFGADLMNAEVGRRFREQVLSRGGERPAMDLVEEFLGRAVDREAFFREIQGE